MHATVLVVGAGMVGVSCALELQRRGHRVTLVDRRGIGEETSSGNAGLLSYSTITPLADPQLLPRLHRLAFNREADLQLHYPHLPALLPWLLRFLARCRRGTYLADGAAMAALTRPSIELHRQWIAEAGLADLLNPTGALKLYRHDRSFRRDDLERELLDRCEVEYSLLDADEIAAIEPDLAPIFVRAMRVEQTLSLRDPQKLCQGYARLFVDAGGAYVRDEVEAVDSRGAGWEARGKDATRDAEHLVICLGAWTSRLLAPLGYRNPLAIERGYHMLLAPRAGHLLRHAIFDADASYVLAPMAAGLRVTTGTNLVARETAPNPRQLERALPRLREAFPIGEELLPVPWMGHRPTVPDTLPIVGAAPRHRKLWLAFAHAHMGLTLGPISGRLIADCIDGAPPAPMLTACRPGRWL